MRGHWWSHTITFSRVDAARAGLVAIGLAALWWLVLVADAASIAAAAIGGVALWLVQRVVAHAKLSARATSATTIALFGIALVGAAVGGAVLARGRIVRFDGPVVTATFPTVPYAPLAMPDFTGIDANEATRLATKLGLAVTIVGDGGADLVVLGQKPAAGTTGPARYQGGPRDRAPTGGDDRHVGRAALCHDSPVAVDERDCDTRAGHDSLGDIDTLTPL